MKIALGTLADLAGKWRIGPEILDRVSPTERALIDKLVDALRRISADQGDPSMWTWAVMLLDLPFDSEGRRKPLAWRTTATAAQAYEALSGRPVTRVSRPYKVGGKRSSREDSEFARFLADLFAILDIKASASGQVALLMRDPLWKQRRSLLIP